MGISGDKTNGNDRSTKRRDWEWIDHVWRSRLKEIAIHEAGHGVLAWLTSRRIERVWMISDSRYAKLRRFPLKKFRGGCILLAPLPPGIDLKDELHRALAEREAMISLGGELAAHRFRGCRWKQVLNKSDLEGLDHAAAHAGKRMDTYLDRIAARTSQYLDVYWRQVEVLADVLLRHRVLTGRQVIEILCGVESRGSRRGIH